MCRADVKVISTVQLTCRNPEHSTFENDVIVRPVMVIGVALKDGGDYANDA